MKSKEILTWGLSNLRTILLVGLLVTAFFFLRQWGTGYFQYKRDIKDLNDSIAQMDKEYLLIEESLSVSQEIGETALNEARLYRDSLRKAENRIYINNVRHESEVANLNRIPTDSLYLDVTAWLDTLSFQ